MAVSLRETPFYQDIVLHLRLDSFLRFNRKWEERLWPWIHRRLDIALWNSIKTTQQPRDWHSNTQSNQRDTGRWHKHPSVPHADAPERPARVESGRVEGKSWLGMFSSGSLFCTWVLRVYDDKTRLWQQIFIQTLGESVLMIERDCRRPTDTSFCTRRPFVFDPRERIRNALLSPKKYF